MLTGRCHGSNPYCLRKNLAGDKVILKYGTDEIMPVELFKLNIPHHGGPQIKEILAGEEWTPQEAV